MAKRRRTARPPKPANLDVQIAIVPRALLPPRCGLTLLVSEAAARELKLSNGETRNALEYWHVHRGASDAQRDGAIVLARDVDGQK